MLYWLGKAGNGPDGAQERFADRSGRVVGGSGFHWRIVFVWRAQCIADLYATVPLGEPQEIRVEQENGCVNVVAVTEDGAYMKSSSCDNQLCVQQGMVTLENWQLRMLGRQIICLPNQVVVEIASQTQSVPQGDQPDV